MYCPNCGTLNDDQATFCVQCGTWLIQDHTDPEEIRNRFTQTSGFATASLVLGIIGIIINPLSIPAIIFGAIAINQTGKNPYLSGRGKAIAGLILGTIVAVIWILILIYFGAIFFGYNPGK